MKTAADMKRQLVETIRESIFSKMENGVPDSLDGWREYVDLVNEMRSIADEAQLSLSSEDVLLVRENLALYVEGWIEILSHSSIRIDDLRDLRAHIQLLEHTEKDFRA